MSVRVRAFVRALFNLSGKVFFSFLRKKRRVLDTSQLADGGANEDTECTKQAQEHIL